LNTFIQDVSKHEVFGNSEELKIFINQNTEEFRRMKKNIDRQMEELNNTGISFVKKKVRPLPCFLFLREELRGSQIQL